MLLIGGRIPPVLGGLEYYVSNLSRFLEKAGWNVFLLTEKYDQSERHEKIGSRTVFRYSMNPSFNVSSYVHDILWAMRKVPHILRIVWKYRIDIIHTHTYLSALAATICRPVLNVPTIATLLGPLPLPRNRFLRFVDIIVRLVIGHQVVAIVADSEELKRNLQRSYFRKDKLFTIPNAVSSHFFSKETKNPLLLSGVHRPTILFVGRISEEKGLPYLIEAFVKILDQVPEARLIIAGDGTGKPNICRRVFDLGIEESVEFAGIVREQDLVTLYLNSDVYVLPSIYDAAPTSLLEAMATGRPIVATSVGGVPETIENERDALLVPPKNPTALAEAILRLLDDKELGSQLGSRARDKIETYRTWDKIGLRFLSLYEQVSPSKK